MVINMGKSYTGEAVCGAVMAVTTAIQTNEYLQTIQLVICIIAGILGIALTLWRLIKMYKQAKADGKITNEERAEMAAEIVNLNDQIKELSELANKSKEDTKDDNN